MQIQRSTYSYTPVSSGRLHNQHGVTRVTLMQHLLSYLSLYPKLAVCVCNHVRRTCEVVEAVMLKDLVQDAQQLPHLGGDGLTCEAERQR